MLARFVVGSGFVLAWLSVILIPKKQFKRFIPAGLLSSLTLTIVYEMAYIFGWWKIKRTIPRKFIITDYAFVLGPFIVGTVWVFHLTYRFGFFVYFLMNFLLDSFFAFIMLPFLERIGVAKLKKISHSGVFGLMMLIAFIIYPYQKWQDGLFITAKKFDSL